MLWSAARRGAAASSAPLPRLLARSYASAPPAPPGAPAPKTPKAAKAAKTPKAAKADAPPAQPWLQLNRSFVVPEVQERKVDISAKLQPRFPAGQTVYESSDFSMGRRKHDQEMRAITAIEGTNRVDRFAQLGVNPLELWKSPGALSEFITTNGRIMPGWVLGTKGRSQKKLAKAVRRCRAAGLLSTVHRSVFDST